MTGEVGPRLPDARAPYIDGAKVVDFATGANGTVAVTYSIPGHGRVVVSVPYDAWLAGEHTALAPALARSLAAMAPVPERS